MYIDQKNNIAVLFLQKLYSVNKILRIDFWPASRGKYSTVRRHETCCESPWMYTL